MTGSKKTKKRTPGEAASPAVGEKQRVRASRRTFLTLSFAHIALSRRTAPNDNITERTHFCHKRAY